MFDWPEWDGGLELRLRLLLRLDLGVLGWWLVLVSMRVLCWLGLGLRALADGTVSPPLFEKLWPCSA